MYNFTLAMLTILICALPKVQAAEITLKDGSVLFGEIVTENDEAIVIDGIFGNKREAIRCERAKIQSIKPGSVPAGYFDEVSPKKDSSTADLSYLCIPLQGEFGKEVFAPAIKKICSYAKRFRIKHIVLDINMSTNGDLDEAIDCIRTLQQSKRGLTIHAFVRQAKGHSIGLLVLADHIYIESGTSIGGLHIKTADTDDEGYASAQHALGMKAVRLAQSEGKGGQIIRAMVDPSATLTAWKNDAGSIDMSSLATKDVAEDKIVFRCEDGALLQLNAKQLSELGTPVISSIKDIGANQHIDAWQGNADYANKIMGSIAASEKKRRSTASKQHERKVEKYSNRRDEINESLVHSIEMAAKWDPSEASYSTYQASWSYNRRLNNGRRRQVNNDSYGTYDTRQMTQDSKKRWQQRSDISIKHLANALKYIKSLKDVEKKCERLGLERIYSEDNLRTMYDDIQTKHKNLKDNRNRREM